MPLYRFLCPVCSLASDEFRKIESRDDPLICPKDRAGMQRIIMPTMVQADIQPYMSAAVDKETGKPVGIQSRKQHREFLRRNDYVEIGNDAPRATSRDITEPDAPMLSVEEMKKQGFIEEAY